MVMLALAGRLGIALELADFDRLTANVPLLVDLQPSGRFLMEDLHYAGGLPAVMKELGPVFQGAAVTAWGQPIGDSFAAAECYNREVIHTLANPANAVSGIWVLKGNLCPQGAVLKPSAASPALFSHRGPAIVFESIEDLRARIDALADQLGLAPPGEPEPARVRAGHRARILGAERHRRRGR